MNASIALITAVGQLLTREFKPPPGVTSVGSLKVYLAQRHAGFAEALTSPGVVRCAVNQDYVPEDAPLRAGDEVAFFPPVTGG